MQEFGSAVRMHHMDNTQRDFLLNQRAMEIDVLRLLGQKHGAHPLVPWKHRPWRIASLRSHDAGLRALRHIRTVPFTLFPER
jgi:hypothetical protein